MAFNLALRALKADLQKWQAPKRPVTWRGEGGLMEFYLSYTHKSTQGEMHAPNNIIPLSVSQKHSKHFPYLSMCCVCRQGINKAPCWEAKDSISCGQNEPIMKNEVILHIWLGLLNPGDPSLIERAVIVFSSLCFLILQHNWKSDSR